MALPNPHAIFLLVLVPVVFFLFTRDKVPIMSTALGLFVVLLLLFTVVPYEGARGLFGARDVFASFGNEALVTIAALMILGHGLTVTGALEPVAQAVTRLWALSSYGAMLFVLMISGLFSGFLNDTPIVVLLIPILLGVAARTKSAASQTLLPMNYAVLIGGMGTTIGTSTNILVVSIAASLGMERIGMFDFTPVTAIAALPALLYLWLIAPRLLPRIESPLPQSVRIYDAWLYVTAESGFAGRTLQDVLTKFSTRPRVREVKRGKNLFLMRLPTLELQVDDRLLVRGTREELARLSDELGLPLHQLDEADLKDQEEVGNANPDLQIAELVVSQDAPLVGSTIRESRLAEETGFIVLGLRRPEAEERRRPDEVQDTIIQGGDVLLVQGSRAALTQIRHRSDFLVLDGVVNLPRNDKTWIALATMLVVVSCAATGILPISVAALAGALTMVVTSCLTWEDVAQSVSGKVIIIVAASIALGAALTATGGTDFLASAFLALTRQLTPEQTLSALILLTALITNFVSNTAAAAIATPVAVSVAAQIGASPVPFVLAVLFGANLSYLTPMAYQTNLLVMGAAGYRFKDFTVVGAPLLVLMWLMYSWLLPKFFPPL